MKIAFINGSPKIKNSASKEYLKLCQQQLGPHHTYVELHPSIECISAEELNNLNEVDVILCAFPLYYDGIPGHLLENLHIIEAYTQHTPLRAKIYVIVNAGFYEGEQCRYAIDLMKQWTIKSKLSWGMALGIGAGSMLAFMKQVPLHRGPRKSLGRGFDVLIQAINTQSTAPDFFISPVFLRSLYILLVHMSWIKQGKKHHHNRKELYQKH